MEVFYGCLCLLGGVLLQGVFREGVVRFLGSFRDYYP